MKLIVESIKRNSAGYRVNYRRRIADGTWVSSVWLMNGFEAVDEMAAFMRIKYFWPEWDVTVGTKDGEATES